MAPVLARHEPEELEAAPGTGAEISSRIDTPKPLSDSKPGKTFIGGVAWAQGSGVQTLVAVSALIGFGTKAGLDWKQENPNYLDLLYADKPALVYKRGNDYLDPIVKHHSRLPFGHPEGFIEAFANVYLGVADLHDVDGAICDHFVVMRRMPEERRRCPSR